MPTSDLAHIWDRLESLEEQHREVDTAIGRLTDRTGGLEQRTGEMGIILGFMSEATKRVEAMVMQLGIDVKNGLLVQVNDARSEREANRAHTREVTDALQTAFNEKLIAAKLLHDGQMAAMKEANGKAMEENRRSLGWYFTAGAIIVGAICTVLGYAIPR